MMHVQTLDSRDNEQARRCAIINVPPAGRLPPNSNTLTLSGTVSDGRTVESCNDVCRGPALLRCRLERQRTNLINLQPDQVA